MLKNLAEDLAQILAANNIIKVEDCDAYRYGLELAISKTIMYTIVLIIALLTNTLLFSILFIGMYMELRQYTGGFHCKSAEMCLVVSALIYLIVLLLYLVNSINIKIILAMVSLIIPLLVLIFSPIESINNPLTKDEKKKYHYAATIVSLVLVFIMCVALLFNADVLFYASSESLTADAVLIILSLRRSKNEKNCYENGGSNS